MPLISDVPDEMNPLKLVVFDCDGTLVDSQHMIVASMRQAFADHAREAPSREEILSIVGLSLPEAIGQLIGEQDPQVDSLTEGYKTAFHALRAADKGMEPLYDGAREALDALAGRDDVIVGMATGKSQRGVRLVMGHHGLYDRFSVIKTADDAPSKPHPGMLIDAMAEMGVGPADTVMIGDTSFDMAMARAAGCAALGVSWGYHHPQDLADAGAHDVIHRFDALVPWLDGRWARS
jgi:phosphoglycolate phosphatase